MSVTFDSGSSCSLPTINDPLLCKPEGIVYSTGPKITAADVATTIHASYHADVRGGESPLVVTGPSSAASAPLRHGPGPGLVITFTARVAIRGPLSTYDVEIHRPVVPECFGEGRLQSNQTSPTLSAGETTQFIIRLQAACHGRYSGRVFYFSIKPSFEPAGEENLISEMSANLVKPALHLPPTGITIGYFTVNIPFTGAHDGPTEVSPEVTQSAVGSRAPGGPRTGRSLPSCPTSSDETPTGRTTQLACCSSLVVMGDCARSRARRHLPGGWPDSRLLRRLFARRGGAEHRAEPEDKGQSRSGGRRVLGRASRHLSIRALGGAALGQALDARAARAARRENSHHSISGSLAGAPTLTARASLRLSVC